VTLDGSTTVLLPHGQRPHLLIKDGRAWTHSGEDEYAPCTASLGLYIRYDRDMIVL